MYEYCKGKSQFTAKYWVSGTRVHTILELYRRTKKLLIDHCPAIVPDTTSKPRKERKTLKLGGSVYIRRNLSSDNRLTVCYIYIYRYIATSYMEGFPISQSLSFLFIYVREEFFEKETFHLLQLPHSLSLSLSLSLGWRTKLKKKRKRECLSWIDVKLPLRSPWSNHVIRSMFMIVRQPSFLLQSGKRDRLRGFPPGQIGEKKKEDRSRNPIRMPSGTMQGECGNYIKYRTQNVTMFRSTSIRVVALCKSLIGFRELCQISE